MTPAEPEGQAVYEILLDNEETQAADQDYELKEVNQNERKKQAKHRD